MGSVAWRKVVRDLWLIRGRTAVLIGALALGLVAVGAVLGAYGILAREMPRSYRRSNPAAATLVLDRGADAGLLDAVRRRPGIADAEARAAVRARVDVGPDARLPLNLFVVEDFVAMRLETVISLQGDWPPPAGTVLLERTSLALLQTAVGQTITVTTAGGPRPVRVAGAVADLGVAPAWQEQSGYAYATPETLAGLGEPVELDLLKIAVAPRPADAAAVERAARGLSAWLAQQGVAVEEIRVPPPDVHPHQRLMSTLALVLLLFGGLALALSAVLVATLVSGMLARHVRQIGAMKAIGARPRQIAAMYAAMVLLVGAAAVAVGLPPAVAGARWLAGAYAERSNVALGSLALPGWFFPVVGLAGLLAPLLAAAVPVHRASTATVREAVSEAGAYRTPAGGPGWALAGRVTRALGPALVLALRSAVRRPTRLLLTLSLLAVGGGTFMSGLNVAAASERQLAQAAAALTYDAELQLRRPEATERLLPLVRAVPGVAYAEPFGFASVAPARSGEVPLSRTYKDGGHGALPLYALPPDSRFRPELLSGRWLEPGAADADAVVLAPGELARLGTAVGGTASFALAGRTTSWRVVGTARGVGLGGGGGAFVSEAGLARATGEDGTTRGLRVVAAQRDPAGRLATQRAVEDALGAAGIGVAGAAAADWWATVLRNHVALVQGALLALGVAMGAVGGVTLASAMGTSVAERTREFGILQTLGATPARVTSILVAEAVFVGALSWLGAVALAAALSALVGGVVGVVIYGAPLPVVVSPAGALTWLALALAGSAAASAVPAAAAGRLTIREALASA